MKPRLVRALNPNQRSDDYQSFSLALPIETGYRRLSAQLVPADDQCPNTERAGKDSDGCQNDASDP